MLVVTIAPMGAPMRWYVRTRCTGDRVSSRVGESHIPWLQFLANKANPLYTEDLPEGAADWARHPRTGSGCARRYSPAGESAVKMACRPCRVPLREGTMPWEVRDPVPCRPREHNLNPSDTMHLLSSFVSFSIPSVPYRSSTRM